MKKLLCVMLCCLTLLSVPVAAEEKDTQDWVIFVYLCGTDLESDGGAATKDLSEMLNAGTAENVRFVVQTGGTRQWAVPDVIPGDRISRFEVHSDDLFSVYEGELSSMGDAATLNGFVSWGFENYKAERYGLILWNHGSGSISGVCFDELYDQDSLTLEEIGAALAGFETSFEFIGFDACLMATLETAQVVAPFARYMVASEELEPGSGWDYLGMGAYLAEHPTADGAELGQAIADGFLASNVLMGDEAITTLSVVALNELPALAQALDAIGWQMLDKTSDKAALGAVVQGIHKAENYGGNTPQEGYTNMVDIGSMMRNISGVLPEAENVLTALEKAVVYRVAGSGRQGSSGLSVYYPLQVQGSQEYEVFKKASPSEGYRRFVSGMLYGFLTGETETFVAQSNEQGADGQWLDSALSGLQEGPPSPGFETDELSQITLMAAYLDEEGTYTLEIDPETMDYLLSATFTLLMDEGDGVLFDLGEDDDLIVDTETGLIRDNFGGLWTALPDGQLISLNLIEQNDDYNVYSAPVLLGGRETNLRILYDWEAEAFLVIGAWDGISASGASAKEIVKIKAGDEIVPLYDAYDAETGDWLRRDEGEAYMAEENFTIEYMQLPMADYYYSFTLTDLYGLESYTDFALFKVDENGELWFYQE